MAFTLHITGPFGSKTVTVETELTIGRTDQANVALDDSGLSRINTTFFVDDGELLVTDENSTNGTYVNGDRVEGRPRILKNGDRLKLGTHTEVRVETGAASSSQPAVDLESSQSPRAETRPVASVSSQTSAPKPKSPPKAKAQISNTQTYLIVASAAMTLLILILGGFGIYLLVRDPKGGGRSPAIVSTVIPVRVIDPLGGEDEDDLDDLIASWETAEEEIKSENVEGLSVESADAEITELNVSPAQLEKAKRKAFEPRPGEGGIRPAGLNVPKELFGDGVIKQKMKLKEMNTAGYRQPMDFADLAEKRMSNDQLQRLQEMPMATDSFYLDVGGSAQDSPINSFAFPNERVEIATGHPKFTTLSQLAGNFAGKKYDLANAADRKQMRMRLLRMFNPRAKPILKELSGAYHGRFGRPLRVTSLTRSMDYQILLNAGNANSFKVRGEGSLPPHTSGCAFDLARKHMPVDEQNFVMAKLAEMERDGKLDALIEYGVNACFHIFIYHDGIPPRAYYFGPREYETIPLFASITDTPHVH
ncbi:MAG: FHA domain-containing protein [Pyrinomonadaceae bacterium]